jgi:hypothetical protein
MVTWVMWNLVSVRLETLLVSVNDRCTVYVKCTIGSEIVLDTPDGTPRGRGTSGRTPHDVDQVRSHFGMFGCKVDARFVSNVT